MKLNEIYELAVEMGRNADPLGFANFPDCMVINDPGAEVSVIFAGIDIGVSELLLVDKLKSKGLGIDAVLGHHPIASAAYLMAGVARIQQRAWEGLGIDPGVCKKFADRIIREADIEMGAENLLRARDAAQMLNLPLLCIHTPLDNLVQDFFSKMLEGKSHLDLEVVLDIIKQVPEYRMSGEDGVEPFLLKAKGMDHTLGRYMVDMTGGLDPPCGIFSYLKQAGVDTIVGMHYTIENIKAMEDSALSAIVCGHMASDSIGMNLFCDRLQEIGIKVINGGGFYRFRRSERQNG